METLISYFQDYYEIQRRIEYFLENKACNIINMRGYIVNSESQEFLFFLREWQLQFLSAGSIAEVFGLEQIFDEKVKKADLEEWNFTHKRNLI